MSTTTTTPLTPVLIEDLGMIHPNDTAKQKRNYGLYECPYCNTLFKARKDSVKSKSTVSCGCYSKTCHIKHGLRYHPIYNVWKNIIGRCNNPKHSAYKDYGKRGISVCERWKDVANFIEDMYPTYKAGLSIDRENHLGNYEPSNCRWTTQTVQTRNTRVLQRNNTSGYRGVSWSTSMNKWSAQITVNWKNINLGYYNLKIDAAIAYDTYIELNNLEHTPNNIKG